MCCEGSTAEPRVWCEGSREEPGVCGVRGPQRSLVCVCGLGVSTAERRVWGVRGPQQSLVFGVRTLKSLLQHHSSKASILWHSAFFTVQLSHPCMTTGKTIALTRRTFVGKVMSLLLKTLSRLVITFLPRSKRLLISWLQSPSAVILEPPKNKVCHCFHCFPIYLP